MNRKTKLKKGICIILLFLILFNFIDLIIVKNSVFAANMDGLDYLYDINQNDNIQDGPYDNGKVYIINGKRYGLYAQDGKMYGLEYQLPSNGAEAGVTVGVDGSQTYIYEPVDKAKAKELGMSDKPEGGSTDDLGRLIDPEDKNRGHIQQDGTESVNKTSINSDSDDDPLSDLIDGAAGLILYPAKILPLLLGKIIETILGLFSGNGLSLSISDILFNKLEITSVDFFDFNSSDATANSIRENVAIWYYSIRNIAAVALVAIAIYVGIRMAIATVAAEKAKYSSMLVDWLTSLALLFVLHYVMILIINLNNSFVKAMTPDNIAEDVSQEFFNNAWKVGFTQGVGSAIAYLMLVGMTFIFLLSYLKRMITIAFLIIISPLVTVTYSIDKMGDNKSQALNTWLKEFTYNIILQPFQCVTYLAIGNTALNLLAEDKSLKTVVIAIAMLFFIYSAEKIVRHIFHMDPKSMSDTVGSAVFASTMLGAIGKGKNSGGKGSSGSDDETKKANKQVASKYATPLQNVQMSAQTPSDGNSPNSNYNLNMAQKAGLRMQNALNNMTTVNSNDSQNKAAVKNAVRSVGGQGKNAGTKIKGFATQIGRSKLFRGYIGLTARATGAITGIGLGGATGDVKNMFAGVNTFMSQDAKYGDAITENIEKSNLNNAMDRYQQATGMSREEVRQHAIDLMRGDYQGDYIDEDFALKNAVDDLNKRYTKQGKDGDAVIATLDKQFEAHEQDLETAAAKKSAKKRYTANLKNKKFSNRQSGQTQSNSQGVSQTRNAEKAQDAADKADI